MNLKEFYGARPGEGIAITGRIRKSADMFHRYLPSTDRLLDIGCGLGDVTLYLKDATGAKEVYGVEIAENHAEQARKRGVMAFALDVGTERLPFDEGFFDAIFCGEVIEHLADTDHLMEEINRTLSKRGLCVLTTPNLAAWYNRLTLLLGFQPFYTQVSLYHPVGRLPFVGGFGAGGHLRVFTLRALKELVRLHRFRIVAVQGASVFDMGDRSRMPFLQKAAAPVDRLCTIWPSLACGLILALARV